MLAILTDVPHCRYDPVVGVRAGCTQGSVAALEKTVAPHGCREQDRCGQHSAAKPRRAHTVCLIAFGDSATAESRDDETMPEDCADGLVRPAARLGLVDHRSSRTLHQPLRPLG